MNSQRLVDFADAPFEIIDGDRGKNYPKQNEFSSKGHCLFLNAGNVTKYGFNFSNCQFISEQKDVLLRKGKLQKNDVVLTTRGTIGNSAYFNSHVDFENIRINSGMVIFRCNEFKINSSYLYLFLRSSSFHAQVNSLKTGVAQPQLPIRDIKRIKIAIPSLPKQKKISEFLTTYDDLIENNRRRIQLLEESARLLYREWFVRLRFPGHEHVKVVDGVPEGWELKQIKNMLAKVKRPGKIKKVDYLAEGTIPCIDQSQSFIGGYTEQQEAVITTLPMIIFGDHTRILKYIDFPFACGADGTQLLMPNDLKITQEFFFFALDSIDLSNYFYARHFKFLKDQYVVRPTDTLIVQFTQFVRPMMQQIKALQQHNCKLAQARDLLLPRLMNGEITL